jgi:quercetin dioxygenase-like cupin family protein
VDCAKRFDGLFHHLCSDPEEGSYMSGIDLSRQARSLVDLVAYQDGAVVSRTLIKKTSGSVTEFAFDENESLAEHTTPHDALVLVLEGELEITLAGESRRVPHGQVLLMPGSIPHAVHAVRRSKMLLVMLHNGDA